MKKVWCCGVVFLFFVSSVEAKLYKCTTPEGSVVYSGISCANDKVRAKRLDRKSYKNIENASTINYEIHKLCSKKYSHDEYMKGACVNKQTSSFTHLIRIQDIYPKDSDPQVAIASCIEKWTDEDGFVNYLKALRCTKSIFN